ncbi:MAG: YwaF family protein, partial [Clostridia bacterium]|nr:YwaF family protein [Clostridia bacterium]
MYTDAEKKLIPLMFFILLLITISLWLLLRHRGQVAQSIPFIVITLALIAGEVAKQVISYRQGYNLWHLPLHFCSTYFLWFSLAEFSFGKMRRTMQNIAFVATMYLFVAFYVSPRGILGDTCEDVFADYFTAHSFFYHHLVILYMMLAVAFKRFQPKKTDAWVWIICFACYFAVAAICAYTLQENFFNILNSESLPIL